jgi:hypothetical protein
MLRKLTNTEDHDNHFGPLLLSVIVSVVVAVIDVLLLL